MKSLGGGIIPSSGLVTAKRCIHFALSQPISSLVVGIQNDRDLKQALEVGRDFKALTGAQQVEILDSVKSATGDGRHELFKSTTKMDGSYHRKQHGFALD